MSDVVRDVTDLLTQVRLIERQRCALIVRHTAAYWRELGKEMRAGNLNNAIAAAIDAVALDIEDSR